MFNNDDLNYKCIEFYNHGDDILYKYNTSILIKLKSQHQNQ